MYKQALGLVETYGYIGAVEAADVSLKAANVSLINCEMTGGGLVSIKICGDVGAVKAAVDAAKAAVKGRGCLISAHVIPRPAEELKQIIYLMNQQKSSDKIEEDIPMTVRPLDEQETVIKVSEVITNESEMMESDSKAIKMPKEDKELMGMRVVDLRTLARQLEGIKLDKNEIRFAKKDELVKMIMAYKERGGCLDGAAYGQGSSVFAAGKNLSTDCKEGSKEIQ